MGRLTRWGVDARGQALMPVPLVRRRQADARRALRKAVVACAVPEPIEDSPALELLDAELDALLEGNGFPVDDEPPLPPIDDEADDAPEFEPGDFHEPVIEIRPRRATDHSRFIAAMRAKDRVRATAPLPEPDALAPAHSPEECRRCGIPGRKGCAHQAAYVHQFIAPARREIRVAGRLMRESGPC